MIFLDDPKLKEYVQFQTTEFQKVIEQTIGFNFSDESTTTGVDLMAYSWLKIYLLLLYIIIYDPNNVLSINQTPKQKSFTIVPTHTNRMPYYDIERIKAMIPIMRLNCLINDEVINEIQLNRLRLIFDNLARREAFLLPELIPRLDWQELDPFDFELPIYIPTWTGEHERYIFLHYFLYFEKDEEFSIESINYKIDTQSDPNFGELGFRWIYLTPDQDILLFNTVRYKIWNYCWFQENPRNDQQSVILSSRYNGADQILQSTTTTQREQIIVPISYGQGNKSFTC